MAGYKLMSTRVRGAMDRLGFASQCESRFEVTAGRHLLAEFAMSVGFDVAQGLAGTVERASAAGGRYGEARRGLNAVEAIVGAGS
jgi:hypothetical protein